MYRTREEIEEFERVWLAPYAAKSAESRGRDHPSTPHPYRTEFQKDRDRIIHTTAFRRLQYKTQVFVNYEGDYYRTRLTHTHEAAQIGRTIARALRVNEDLTEAITLAHDLGHSPFGHNGEVTLDRIMLERMGLDPVKDRGKGFNHTVQTLRIIERLEKRWEGFEGLNLTWETREGIVKHATEYDLVGPEFASRFEPDKRASIESQIVNFADELIYNTHDLDDGLRSGLLEPEMPALQHVTLWREIKAEIDRPFSELTRHRMIRLLIDRLITDLIDVTDARISAAAPKSIDDVRNYPENLVDISPELHARLRELKDFLYENLYRNYRVARMANKAERVITALFTAFESDYEQLPPKTREMVKEVLEAELSKNSSSSSTAAGTVGSSTAAGTAGSSMAAGTAGSSTAAGTAGSSMAAGITGRLPIRASRIICDYIAGMTDRYALQEYQRLFDPNERA